MKKRSLLEKLSFFSRKKKNKDSGASALSKEMDQKGYKAKHLSSASRKKSLREKWQAKKEGHGQQTAAGVSPKKEKEQSFFRKAIVVGVVLLGGYIITIGALSTFLGDLLYFRIHEIEFSGCAVTNQKTLRKYADISYELNMLTLQPKLIEERLEQHPWIEQATIRRIWPDSLVVSIKEYRPRALVVQDGEEGFQYLDRNDMIRFFFVF